MVGERWSVAWYLRRDHANLALGFVMCRRAPSCAVASLVVDSLWMGGGSFAQVISSQWHISFFFSVPCAALADTTAYSYDSLGRLTGSTVDRGYLVSTSIAYDPAGNRSSYQVTGGANGSFATMSTTSDLTEQDEGSAVPPSPQPMTAPVIQPYLDTLNAQSP